MNRLGIVTKIDGPWVTINTQPMDACCGKDGEGGCKCSGSGEGVEFRAYNKQNLILKTGDEVEAIVETKESILGLLGMLILPVVFSLVGFFVAWFFLERTSTPLTAATAIGFVLGLFLDLVLIKPKAEAFPMVSRVVPLTRFVPHSPSVTT